MLRMIGIVMGLALAATGVGASEPFRIRVVDDETGRGIPLAEFRTVNHVLYVTDSAGQIAFEDAESQGNDVFFFVKCQGYERPKAAFGFEGVRLKVQAGAETTVRLKRINIAERLCRLTGEGRYRDSVLLGDPVPADDRLTRGGVVGQDSVQAAVYRGAQYWFWGDTSRAAFPLGLFRTAGARTAPFGAGRDTLDRGFRMPISLTARPLRPGDDSLPRAQGRGHLDCGGGGGSRPERSGSHGLPLLTTEGAGGATRTRHRRV